MYHILFVRLSIVGHLVSFHFLATMNNAAEYSFFLCISGLFSKDDIVPGCEKIF